MHQGTSSFKCSLKPGSPTKVKGQGRVGAPNNVLPCYENCVQPWDSWRYRDKYPRDIGLRDFPWRGTLGSGYIQLSPEKSSFFEDMYPPGKDRTHIHQNGSRAGLTHSSTPLIPKCRFKGEVCRICDRFHGGYTPPKTNMEPKNGGLEDDFPFQTGDFQVPCKFSGV